MVVYNEGVALSRAREGVEDASLLNIVSLQKHLLTSFGRDTWLVGRQVVVLGHQGIFLFMNRNDAFLALLERKIHHDVL